MSTEHDKSGGNTCEIDQHTCDTESVAENIHGTDLPPKLEEFLPKEFFPDILIVHDSDDCASGNQGWRVGSHSSSDHADGKHVYRYKRVLPEPESEGGLNNSPRIAALNLSAKQMHAFGHHSSVYRAPFVPPAPLTANSRSKDGSVTVIAKTAFSQVDARSHLENEARIMDTLSTDKYRHMQQEWCGLNMISGLLNPVPVGPVMPKFYGYYVPEENFGHDELSPILLMEDCGMPVDPKELSPAAQ